MTEMKGEPILTDGIQFAREAALTLEAAAKIIDGLLEHRTDKLSASARGKYEVTRQMLRASALGFRIAGSAGGKWGNA